MTLVIMMDSAMRKHTYAWYIATLAVCDNAMLSVRFCSWLNMILLAMGKKAVIGFYNDVGCILGEGIPDVMQITGAWMMATIAFERFLIVWFPFITTRLSPKVARLIIVGVFIFAILSTLYYIIYIRFVSDVNFCAVPQEIGWITQLYLGFPMEYIPALVIIISNALVVFSLFRHRPTDTSKVSSKARNKITAMLLLLTCSFLILTLPAWIFEGVVKRYFGSISGELPAREIIEFFYQMNYGINFFIYVISGNEVRLVMKRRVLSCMRFVGVSFTRNPASSMYEDSLSIQTKRTMADISSSNHM
ncbi:uncharacterized protein LOC141907293 [Tubulanus polymorphus]|uniref:uncharacterized protein LOC141907293 n=1 Tax=Tubulanus polymorphus TaxID=672921 RepID=UPI003DA337BC